MKLTTRKSSRGRRLPTNRRRKPAKKAAPRIAGVPVETIDFFGSLPGRVTSIRTYCPFCDATVPAKKKSYLMVCGLCGMRID